MTEKQRRKLVEYGKAKEVLRKYLEGRTHPLYGFPWEFGFEDIDTQKLMDQIEDLDSRLSDKMEKLQEKIDEKIRHEARNTKS